MEESAELSSPACTFKSVYGIQQVDRCKFVMDNCTHYDFINYFAMHFCWLNESKVLTYSICVCKIII